MDSVPRRLDVDSGVALELEPDLAASLEGAFGEQSPELRQQSRERQVGCSGRPGGPQRLGQLVAADDAIATDGEVREEAASLPARQLVLDAPAGHSNHEAPAQLNPSPFALRLPLGHSAKLPPTPNRDNAAMAFVIKCDCGYVSRGETEEELVEETNRHIADVHPGMAGKVSRDDLLAMAEEL